MMENCVTRYFFISEKIKQKEVTVENTKTVKNLFLENWKKEDARIAKRTL